VGAVDGDNLSLHRPRVQELFQQVFEDQVIVLLPESASEVGEEAVAGGVLLESAGFCGFSVVFEA